MLTNYTDHPFLGGPCNFSCISIYTRRAILAQLAMFHVMEFYLWPSASHHIEKLKMKYRCLCQYSEQCSIRSRIMVWKQSRPLSNHRNRPLAPKAYYVCSISIPCCDSTYCTRSCEKYVCCGVFVRACAYMCLCVCTCALVCLIVFLP